MIIPRLGSSDESDEVLIPRWLKTAGADVEKRGGTARSRNDKINVEVEAPGDGKVTEIRAQEGEFVKFGAVVAVIDKKADSTFFAALSYNRH